MRTWIRRAQRPSSSHLLNAHQDGISLLIPQVPGPYQRQIKQYQWDFGDNGGFSLYDNSSNDKMIKAVLAALAANPNDSGLRTRAIELAILPNDAAGNVFGLGGWTSSEVRQLVGVWQAYFFKYHIVPHAFDYYGTVGVRLTITDRGGQTSQYVQNYAVSRDCLPWGGPLSSWFHGYTTCDTYNGIAVQFGPHREPDYLTANISPELASIGQFGAGVSLTIVRGVRPTDRPVILVGSQLTAGLGVSFWASLNHGWLGPPDPADQPTQADVVSFVSQADILGGGAAQYLGTGLGFYGALSLTSTYPPGERLAGQPMAGEELPFATALQAGTVLTCSAPLQNVGSGAERLAQSIFNTWGQPAPKPSPTRLGADLQQLLTAIVGTGADVTRTIVRAIRYCAGVGT